MKNVRNHLTRYAIAILTARTAFGAAAEDQFDFAEGLFISKDYLSAVEEFEGFVTKFPKHQRVAAALYRIAETKFRLEKFDAAANAFEKALRQFPDAKEAGLGSYSLARCRTRLKQPEKALAAFGAAMQKGEPEVRQEAAVGAAECLVELGKLAEAQDAYAKFLTEYPKSKHRAAALFSRGWLQASLDLHTEAAATYEALLAQFPAFNAAGKARLALSDCYTALGNYPKAAEVLDKLKADKALAGDVLLRRAWNLFKSGDRKAAAAAFASFAKVYPQDPLAVPALYNAGIAHFEGKNYAAAADSFRDVLSKSAKQPTRAEHVEARYWLGLCLFNLTDYKQSLATLEPLVKNHAGLQPNKHDTLTFFYAQTLAKAQRYDDAIAQCQALLEKFPKSPHVPAALYALATAHAKSGRLEQAVPPLGKLVKDYPKSDLQPNALFALGEYLYRSGKSGQALPHLETLAAAGNVSDELRYRLGWTYFSLNRFDKSLAQFTPLAAAKNPFAVEAAYMAGRTAEQMKNTKAAVAFYEKLAGKNGRDEFTEKALCRLGFLYDAKKAAANLERYVEGFPKGAYAAELRLKLAAAYFKQGKIDEAARHYTEVLKGNPPTNVADPATYGLAWCYLKQGKLEQADPYFAKISAADLENAVAADAVLQRAEIAYGRKRYDDAKTLFAKLKDQPPPRGERALYMLGWCNHRTNDGTAATACFRELLNKYPKSQFGVDSAIRLAEALIAARKHAEACAVLKPAIARPVKGEQRETLLHLYSDCLVALKQWKDLLESGRTLEQEFPDSKRAFLVAFRLGLAHRELGLLDAAERAFRDTIANTETIEAARAQFNIGTIHFSRKSYVEAAKSFLRVEVLYDYDELAPKALYHTVDAFRRGGDKTRADHYAKRMREKYPASEWTKKLQAE